VVVNGWKATGVSKCATVVALIAPPQQAARRALQDGQWWVATLRPHARRPLT
jgi:hypothetical protein